MYKIPNEVINLIEKTMEGGIDSRREKLSWNKGPKHMFQVDALSPLLFRIAMITLNHILRKNCHPSNEKQETTPDGWKGTITLRRYHNTRRKGDLGYWKLTPSNKWRWKKKLLKNTSGELECYLKKICNWNLFKGINTCTVPLVRYSRPFLKQTRKKI